MGYLWACFYELGIWGPHGSFMGLSVWESPYTSHTGPIWACYLGPTWVLYGRVLYALAHMGNPVYIAHWAYMGLISRPHMRPLWGCPHGLVRMGPIYLVRFILFQFV